MGVIKTQAHNVNGFARKGDRNLHARQVFHALCFRRSDGTILTANLVVVCKRPKLHAVGLGPRRQSFWRERAIGHHGVAMKISVE